MKGTELCAPAADLEEIDRIIDRYRDEKGSLIQVLLTIQAEHHWLPREVLSRVAERLSVPLTRVLHLATFATAFSRIPRGRPEVHVCTGTACHVRGAPRVLSTIEELTGIQPGETDLDLRYSLETVNCLGCCALGPVVEIDGKIHGKVSIAKTEDVLKSCE